MERAIIGAGGFAREVKSYLKIDNIKMFVDDYYWEENNKNILPLIHFDPLKYKVVIAIGDPTQRKNVLEKLPKNTKFFTFIHPTVVLDEGTVEIGEGTIICPYCVLTSDIKVGKHCHFNLLSTVGHDTVISDFATTAPGAKISGNCKLGECVYMGTNSSIKEKINICDDVTIGANACVVKDIFLKGTYVGVPAKLNK